MNLQFERHIQRKLKLVECLYYSHKQFTVGELARKLRVSESTIKSDLRQFGLLSEAGIVLNIEDKDKRFDLHDKIMGDSPMTRIMRMLLLYPGKRAEYYSDALSISRVNFYKHVNFWNERLRAFNASIIVSDGYHIVAQDERLFRFFIFYFLLATNTENRTFIEKNIEVLSNVLRHNNLHIGTLVRGGVWESTFAASLLGVTIIRQSDKRTAIAIPTAKVVHSGLALSPTHLDELRELLPSACHRSIMESLVEFKSILMDAPRRVQSQEVFLILKQYEKTMGYPQSYEGERMLDSLSSILSVASTLHEQFPYNVTGLCVTMKDFMMEYSMVNGEVIHRFRVFLDIASEKLGRNLRQYEDIIFYWVIINVGDYLFTPHKRILYVSRYAKNHFNFCRKELSALMRVLKVDPEIVIVEKSEFAQSVAEASYDLILADCHLKTDLPVVNVAHSCGILLADVLIDLQKQI